MLVAKIVSGGQTGVDRGAIEAALELGFPYGGLIPKGRLAEDGIVPLKFDRMEVAPRKDYLFRTEWNVTHSDATLIITNAVPLSGGTKRTADFCEKHGKPCTVLYDMSSPCCDINSTLCWLKRMKEALSLKDGVVLNVAGPRESKLNGVQAIARKYVGELIEAVRTVNEDELDWRLPEEAMDALYGHCDVQENKGRNILDERSDLKSRIMSIAMVVCAMVAVFAASAENDAPVRRLSEMVVGIGMQNLLKIPIAERCRAGRRCRGTMDCRASRCRESGATGRSATRSACRMCLSTASRIRFAADLAAMSIRPWPRARSR